MKATDFLRKGADLLEERGKQYDQPGGERSMGKAVSAFNTITGRSLTEAEGWLLLQVLKDVRQWQNPGKYHADSAEDCVSYAALKAEALISHANSLSTFMGFPPLDANGLHIEPAAAMQDDSDRMAVIGQSGEMAEEVYAAVDGAPGWDDAPEWAMWLAQDLDGSWYWFEECPGMGDDDDKWYADNYKEAKEGVTVSPFWRNTLQSRPAKDTK